VALLQKTTCNLRNPMNLRHLVDEGNNESPNSYMRESRFKLTNFLSTGIQKPPPPHTPYMIRIVAFLEVRAVYVHVHVHVHVHVYVYVYVYVYVCVCVMMYVCAYCRLARGVVLLGMRCVERVGSAPTPLCSFAPRVFCCAC